MQLSELQYYLDKTLQIQQDFHDQLKNIQVDFNDKLKTLSSELDLLVKANQKILGELSFLENETNRLKEQLQIHSLSSYLQQNDTEKVLSDTLLEEVTPFITRTTDCRYPSLFIGDAYKLVHSMIAADPLYIASYNQKGLQNILERFNPVYQKRLRPYLLSNGLTSGYITLPHKQFSCIVCWNIINYLNIKECTQLLNIIYNLLRPGGTLIFNFVNGDTLSELKAVESYLKPYQTVGDFFKIFNKSGTLTHCSSEADFIIYTKPGKLNTIKLQPVLGEIIAKSS